jgi:hypothetical protein
MILLKMLRPYTMSKWHFLTITLTKSYLLDNVKLEINTFVAQSRSAVQRKKSWQFMNSLSETKIESWATLNFNIVKLNTFQKFAPEILTILEHCYDVLKRRFW